MLRQITAGLTALAIGSAVIAPAVGHAAAPRAAQVVTVTPKNFTTSFPAHLASGALRLQLVTPEKQDGTSVNLAQIHAGVSQATVAQLMRSGKAFQVLPLIRLAGGVDSVGGATRVGLFNLPAGTYVVFSLDQLTASKHPTSPTRIFTVGGTAGVTPQSVATVTAVEFRFKTPASLPAGQDIIKFANAGKEPHEVDIARIDSNKTLADVKMALMNDNGPPPSWFHSVGGWGVTSPGSTMWVQTNLTPGKYVLLCFVPDAFPYPGHKPTNKPHAMLGMVKIVLVK
jgi:hypothetical protein